MQQINTGWHTTDRLVDSSSVYAQLWSSSRAFSRFYQQRWEGEGSAAAGNFLCVCVCAHAHKQDSGESGGANLFFFRGTKAEMEKAQDF